MTSDGGRICSGLARDKRYENDATNSLIKLLAAVIKFLAGIIKRGASQHLISRDMEQHGDGSGDRGCHYVSNVVSEFHQEYLSI